MSAWTVLDASAVLAFLQAKPGHDTVRLALQNERCVVTAVNQAEIIAKATDKGVEPVALKDILAELAYTVVDVTADDGANAGWLRNHTRSLGLSLGDRICLASAQRLKAKVLTADRLWLGIAGALGLEMYCIRPDER